MSTLGQFCTYLQFRGEKYLNTLKVTNVNDCPNLLSYGATFRMGVLFPNYPEENIVRGENVPYFKVNASEGTSSNVFQQYHNQCHSNTVPSTLKMFHTADTAQNMAQLVASFRTTTSPTAMTGTTTTKPVNQVNPVHVHPDTSCKAPLGHCAHVYKLTI